MDKKVYLGSCGLKKCPGPVHVIEQGDTLYSIAQKYHTRVRVLLALNPFVDIYNLQPGDEICIPGDPEGSAADYVPSVVRKGESLSRFLEQHKISFEEAAEINPCLRDILVPEGTIVLLPKSV